MTDTNEAMRAAFEVDMTLQEQALDRDPVWQHQYDDDGVQWAWRAYQRGWQAALASQTVPEGYKLVPKVPTEKMQLAGADIPTWLVSKIYAAMLAAAPTPDREES